MQPSPVDRLLAPTDGSVPAEHAVSFAHGLAAAANLKLEVLSVEPPGLPSLAYGANGKAASHNGNGTRWVTGIPGVEIVRRAKLIKADLVVLGRDARSPRNPLPIGRTADAVMRRLDGTCLWIPPGTTSLSRMLIALDGTRRGLTVLEPAARIAGLLRARVTTIHVLPAEVSGPLDDWACTEPAVERIREALTGVEALGGSDALMVRRGPPIWELLDSVERLGIDLLVLGVRGGGPCGDMGSGHIGRDLLRTAPVAVLTIPI